MEKLPGNILKSGKRMVKPFVTPSPNWEDK